MRSLLLASLLLVGCQSDLDQGSKSDKSDNLGGYSFIVDDDQFNVRRDHAGAPLLATIWGRIAEYSVEAPHVQTAAYNDSEEATGDPWLLHITKRFAKIHKAWAPSFEEMGLDVCSPFGITGDDLLGPDGFNWEALEPEQCFGQKVLWPNPETGEVEGYRRVIKVALPDYLTIELDQPASFPNGRVLNEQINSLMFALAFLDHGGQCTDQEGVTSECDLHTLWKRTDFLKQQNDVPYQGASEIGGRATRFPFLGLAHRIQ